jgi:cell division protein FtsB
VHGLSRRFVWHLVGLIVAVLVAWLVFRGYRQPELLLDFAQMRLC